MTAEKADRAIFITSGVYINEALWIGEGKPLELVDGAQLADPRPSGQALPWSPLTQRMLTVSPPDAHRILALDNIVICGVHREGIR